MKTLNKKNLERINYLIYEIMRDNDLSKNITKESGSKFWFSLRCYYDAKLKSIELFEEYGISITNIIDHWIEQKNELNEKRSNAWQMYSQLMSEADKKRTA